MWSRAFLPALCLLSGEREDPWEIISISTACDCMCQKGTGCHEVAELGTQMWPLQALTLLPQCCTPQVGTHDGQPPDSPQGYLLKWNVWGACVFSRCHSPHSTVSLKTGICCVRKVTLAELCIEVFTPSPVSVTFLPPLCLCSPNGKLLETTLLDWWEVTKIP